VGAVLKVSFGGRIELFGQLNHSIPDEKRPWGNLAQGLENKAFEREAMFLVPSMLSLPQI
jgi:hypothetical protein